MKIEQLRFPHHGRTVHAIAFRPEAEAPVPCVILCHGYNGFQDDEICHARFLAEHGTAAVCITFCGGSTRDISGFPTTQMTLWTERDDILAVMEAAEKDSRTGCLFLHGESMGGMACVLASAAAEDRIAGLSLLYPALCIPDNWRQQYPDAAAIPEAIDLWNLMLGRRFFTEIRDLDTYSVLPAYRGPVLLMHGEDDPVVPVACSRRAHSLYRNAQLVTFPGEGHGFSPAGQEEVSRLLLAFVREHSSVPC